MLFSKPKFYSAKLSILSWLLLPILGNAQAKEEISPAVAINQLFKVRAELSTLTPDVADLKFKDFFQSPVGPRGLVPSKRLSDLHGKRVRLVGYMVKQELPTPGVFLLAAMPLKTSEDDDSMADDLPPAIAFIHLDSPVKKIISYTTDLLQFTGVLSLGSSEEVNTRVSTVRLLLDRETSQALAGESSPIAVSAN